MTSPRSLSILPQVAFVALLLSVSCAGESKVGKAVTPWRSDKEPVEKRLPLLVPIESCLWRMAQATDYSRDIVPAPDEFYLRGYARVGDADASRLLKAYDWRPVVLDVSALDRPTSSSVVESFASSREFFESAQFMGEHMQKSAFPGGRVVFSPETRQFYFDLRSL